MTDFPSGSHSALARAVTAEVRSIMGVRRWSIRELASRAGFTSHNYLAIRLRDEKPLTLDDVTLLCDALGELDAAEFLERCYRNHVERLVEEGRLEWDEARSAVVTRIDRMIPGSVRERMDDEEIAAHDSAGTIEEEQEAPDFP